MTLVAGYGSLRRVLDWTDSSPGKARAEGHRGDEGRGPAVVYL